MSYNVFVIEMLETYVNIISENLLSCLIQPKTTNFQNPARQIRRYLCIYKYLLLYTDATNCKNHIHKI